MSTNPTNAGTAYEFADEIDDPIGMLQGLGGPAAPHVAEIALSTEGDGDADVDHAAHLAAAAAADHDGYNVYTRAMIITLLDEETDRPFSYWRNVMKSYHGCREV